MRPAGTQILVVEPDLALQTAVAAWLEGAGYDCMPVSDADEALAIAQDHEADVALVSGPVAAWSTTHLALALQSRAADLPVIVVREHAKTASLQRRRGAVEEIAAPLTRGTVMHAIRRALEWREATPEERDRYLELERSVAAQVALLREACLGEPCTAAGLTSALVAFLDRRIAGAAARAEGVRAVAVDLAAAIGMDEPTRAAVSDAALLHELGLALLPAALRGGEARLQRLERVLLRRHPELVFDFLAAFPTLAEAARLVRAAHERFDGSGYPYGLSGLEIPMGGRIIALACGVERLSRPQPGTPARPAAEIGAALAETGGGIHDPDLVREWLRLSGRPTRHACH